MGRNWVGWVRLSEANLPSMWDLKTPNRFEPEPEKTKPICLGLGLVALDVIYDGKGSDPVFFAGGSCCNVLTILSYLGWSSSLMTRLGRDPEGDRIVEDVERWGVKTRFVERDSGISSPKIIERIFEGKMPSHRFHLKCPHGTWLPRRRPLTLKSLESIQNMLPKPAVFYFDRADPSALKAARMLKEWGAVIVFEPPRLLRGNVFARCLEVADVVKHCYRQPREIEISETEIPLEIQTRGEKGLKYRTRFLGRDEWMEMEAFPTPRLVDAAGSGDWLTAGLIHTMWGGDSWSTQSEKVLERSLKFGQALASLNCGFVGARGMMYSLGRSQLLSLADEMIAGDGQLVSVSSAKPGSGVLIQSSSKCRVCLCPDLRSSSS